MPYANKWVLRWRPTAGNAGPHYVRGGTSTTDMSEATMHDTAREAAEALAKLGHPEAWSIEQVAVTYSPITREPPEEPGAHYVTQLRQALARAIDELKMHNETADHITGATDLQEWRWLAEGTVPGA